jgi:hypothetical protein
MNPSNHIRSLHMEIRTLNPAEADVRFHVAVDRPDDRLGLKGRLVGPRCAYASTVEVAYPLRDAPPGETTKLSARAIIPEPNFWEPPCPFLYEARIELLEDGNRIDSITMTTGLRTVAISGRSFVLNGKPFEAKAMEPVHLTEPDLAEVRRQFNTVVLPVSDETRPFWHACDQMGLGVVGRVENQSAPQLFSNHPCLLAWIVADEKTLATYRADLLSAHVPIGWQIRNDNTPTDPPDADFVVLQRGAAEHRQEWGGPIMELPQNP